MILRSASVGPVIPVSNLQKSLEFYEDKLGLEGEAVPAGTSCCAVGRPSSTCSRTPTTRHRQWPLQCEWSLWWRGVEDDVVPAARRLGIGLVP